MTSNIALYEVFSTALNIPLEEVHEDLKYNSIPQWDSVAHMTLIAALEDRFDVMLDTDDIIDMNSVSKAVEILSRYGIDFQ
ncbi:acyl carrier protein [Marinobacterium zhoushanense]|uniref:Acyl carrier protein n=1 Tax=Marinobacterium zhoushanense TaxID=1679163 RepID=A0ABQ1KRI0_9GAMM|nr:acyl carrier protein [Marinobacterium zhoushanense]GGC07650.1 acyl carrier protein [Marinobacterium zhoushanense]